MLTLTFARLLADASRNNMADHVAVAPSDCTDDVRKDEEEDEDEWLLLVD